jgi:tripartite-type tricarboxylate transporter receptor subunit TctC
MLKKSSFAWFGRDRIAAAAVSALSMVAFSLDAHAQTGFPNKPVKIIVPSAPGDGSDIMARLVAAKLQERWGQPVTVENRPGAGGVVGTEAAAKSPADGYTVIVGNAGSHAINQALYPKLPYDVTRDFVAVTMLASAPNAFVVNPNVPAKTVAEFIALAKKEPNKFSFASGGNGSSAHLNGEMLNMMADVRMVHVPYKGASPAITDVIGGQVQLMIGNLPPMLPHIKAGKLRLLGVTTPKRFAAVPDAPPIAETVAGFESLAWFGVFAPATTPKDIVAKWHADTVAVLAMSDVKEKIVAQGFDVVGNTPEQYAAIVKSDIAKWTQVVKASGAKPD